MAEWTNILFKAFWCGWAAVGFAILFNVPVKNLFAVWIGGAIVGLVKFTVLLFAPSSIVLASFLAALTVGTFSVIISHMRHEPQILFSIPSIIPLVPGMFAYRTMLGLIKLGGNSGTDLSRALSDTARNGALTLFIVMAFVIGVIIPNQVGKEIAKRSAKLA
jgi:uncharacterized membrane protein YjjB (DUF3815 family)